MLSKLALITVGILIFCGCGGNSLSVKKEPTSKVLPVWISDPIIKDNDNYMYGVSIALDRESAIKAALSDMIAKLGISIESSYESYEEVQGSYYKTNVKNQIKSNVSKIKINNYRVIKSHRIGYREFAVMLETDKQKFILGLKDDLEMKKKTILQKTRYMDKSDTITRYNTAKELSIEAQDLLGEVLMIAELDSNFDKEKNLKFITKKRAEFLTESEKLNFFVSGDECSSLFVDVIKNTLAQSGYKISSSKENAVKIEVKTSKYLTQIDAMTIAVLTLHVDVLDKTQRIGGKSVVLKEIYNGSDDSLYKMASLHFKQDIKSLGINEVIGTNLYE